MSEECKVSAPWIYIVMRNKGRFGMIIGRGEKNCGGGHGSQRTVEAAKKKKNSHNTRFSHRLRTLV